MGRRVQADRKLVIRQLAESGLEDGDRVHLSDICRVVTVESLNTGLWKTIEEMVEAGLLVPIVDVDLYESTTVRSRQEFYWRHTEFEIRITESGKP